MNKQYIDWIMSLPQKDYAFQKIDDDHVIIDTPCITGEISIYHLEMDVVELRLNRKSDHEAIFFLHFELKDQEHAMALTNEMLSCIKSQSQKTHTRILLSCTSGMTTSFFAGKIQEAAKTLDLDYEVNAVSYNDLYNEGFHHDIILLAPQIGYQLKKAKEVFRDKIVRAIPAQIFASYDAGKMIDYIRQELKTHKATKEEKAVAKVMRDIENNASIFVITMTHDIGATKYCHRLYEKGKVIISEEVIKNNQSLNDIRDILDTQFWALRKNYHIDAVSISVPGILVDNMTAQRVDYASISKEFTEKYGLPVYFFHNTAVVAYGYYAGQNKYDIVAYHSQPTGAIVGGQGYVYKGTPIDGKKEMAGEVVGIANRIMPGIKKHEHDKANIQDIKEALITYLVAGISIIAPEVFIIRSVLTPDMEELKNEVRKYIPDHYMPEFIYANDVSEYAYLGTMLYGLLRFKQAVKEKITTSPKG